MAERSKFQFRMRDLLWAVGLMGVEIALMVGYAMHNLWGEALFFFYVSLCTIIGCVHRQPVRGTFIGLGFLGLFLSLLGLAALLIEPFVNPHSR